MFGEWTEQRPCGPLCMASVTQRNDKLEGLWSDCVVRELLKTVAITVAFRHLLSKPTKIVVVLPFMSLYPAEANGVEKIQYARN